ncbi:MAG: ABC transporter, partial [candidate division Zixibacteria bacterium]|nr:ABC transporter [candidate division Zixibacteria bacterium]
ELLVLDEPTANLDRPSEEDLFALLKELNERHTIVLVSHDPTFVSDFVERVVCVNRTVALHPTADMNRESTRDLFGMSVRMVRHDLHGNGK